MTASAPCAPPDRSHRPALHLTALASQTEAGTPAGPQTMLAPIAKALGLGVTACRKRIYRPVEDLLRAQQPPDERAIRTMDRTSENMINVPADLMERVARIEDELARLAEIVREAPQARLRRPPKRGKLSRIEQDPEMRALIDARLETMTQLDIRRACVKTPANDRAPSRTGLWRYAESLRS